MTTLELIPIVVGHPGQDVPEGWLAAAHTHAQRANALLIELTGRTARVKAPELYSAQHEPAATLLDEHNLLRNLRGPGQVTMFWSMGVGHGRDMASGRGAAGWGAGDGTFGQTTIRGEYLNNPDVPIMLYYTLHELGHALGLPHSMSDPWAEPGRSSRIMSYSHSAWVRWYTNRTPGYGLSLAERDKIRALPSLDAATVPDQPRGTWRYDTHS